MQISFIKDDRPSQPIPPLQPTIPIDEFRPDEFHNDAHDLRDMALLDGVPYELLALMTADPDKRNLVAEQRWIRALLNEGYPIQDISRASGLSRSALDRRLKLEGLNHHLAEAAALGIITNTAALAAVSLSPSLQAELARQLASEGKLTVESVRAARLAVRESALPAGSLFDDWSEAPNNWRQEVSEHLSAVLEWLPAAYIEQRGKLLAMLVEFQEESI